MNPRSRINENRYAVSVVAANRELRRRDLAGRLDSVLERTDDRGAALAGQDVLDLKGDGLGQRADIADEIGDRLAAGLAADPGQHPVIALDLESELGVEQGGDLSRIPAAADPFQKLLCNSYVLLMTHLLSPRSLGRTFRRSRVTRPLGRERY